MKSNDKKYIAFFGERSRTGASVYARNSCHEL